LGPVEADRAQQKTPLPFGAGLLWAILLFGSDHVQPRRSGAKKKHQTANKEAYYRKKRARVRRDSSRGRNSSGTRIHRHRIFAPAKKETQFCALRNGEMLKARKNLASAVFCGACLK